MIPWAWVLAGTLAGFVVGALFVMGLYAIAGAAK